MTLPDAETALKTLWGDGYVAKKWWPALKAVMDAENDITAALSTIENIQQATCTEDMSCVDTQTPQAKQTEQELMVSVEELKRRGHIHGDLFMLEELVDPLDEKEIGKDLLICTDEEIVEQINNKKEGLCGAALENESDSDVEAKRTHLECQAAIRMCQELEDHCLDVGGEHTLELSHNLRRFRAQLRREEMQSTNQKTLEDVWGK